MTITPPITSYPQSFHYSSINNHILSQFILRLEQITNNITIILIILIHYSIILIEKFELSAALVFRDNFTNDLVTVKSRFDPVSFYFINNSHFDIKMGPFLPDYSHFLLEKVTGNS